MSNDGSKQEAPWPVPNKRFSVDLGEIQRDVAFQKIRGLRIKYDVVEYRGGNSKMSSNVKMPLGQIASDVTLIKGIFPNDGALFNWFNEVNFNTIKRQTVVINLLDQEDAVISQWILRNAFPKEIAFGELDAMANTFAVEELVITCEEILYGNPP